jgi:hypothetical protein
MMPLIKSKSDKAFKKNISTEVKAGKPVKQAVAIAYSTKRAAKKAYGGEVDWSDIDDAPPRRRGSTNPMHYDSDVDYYKAVGDPRGDEDDDGPDLAPKMTAGARRKMQKSTNKGMGLRRMADIATAKKDKPQSEKLWDRLKRQGESGRLKRFAESYEGRGEKEKANTMRKEWSEKIGKGKPAPFKKGGKVCW